MDNKYTVPITASSINNIIDNPLLPHRGIPVTEDDLIDSTERILNASSTNIVRDDRYNILWDIDPDKFYNDSGLEGNGTIPNEKRVYDLGKFNKVFEREQSESDNNTRLKELNTLNQKSQIIEQKSLYDLSISQIMINTKDTWFNVLDDLLDQHFRLDIFTKENRLFYIGITLFVIAIILYLYTMITSEKESNEKNNIQKIYHIYQYPLGNEGFKLDRNIEIPSRNRSR